MTSHKTDFTHNYLANASKTLHLLDFNLTSVPAVTLLPFSIKISHLNRSGLTECSLLAQCIVIFYFTICYWIFFVFVAMSYETLLSIVDWLKAAASAIKGRFSELINQYIANCQSTHFYKHK